MGNIHISSAENHASISEINKMLLGRREIQQNMQQCSGCAPCIVIKPFRPVCLCENSHTLHLSDTIYKSDNPSQCVKPLPLIGIIARPGDVFYCETYEFIEVHKYHPFIVPSVVARLHGLSVRETGGLKAGGGFDSVKLTITAECLASFSPGFPIAELCFLKKIPQK